MMCNGHFKKLSVAHLIASGMSDFVIDVMFEEYRLAEQALRKQADRSYTDYYFMGMTPDEISCADEVSKASV